MFGKSIREKLASDFSFVKDYGFNYLRDSQHDYVGPSVYFGLNHYTLEIGYDYDKRRIFVLLYDSTKKTYFNKAAICATSQWKDILKGVTLIGSSYKKQVNQVEKILQEYLRKGEISIAKMPKAT
ncbi:MAG: hypothetical protein LBT20_05510 [Clostridiales bacterium]|nr:hypothetical protein [Clostridiales bacterium]